MLAAGLGEKLHADADAEKRPPMIEHRALQRRHHPRQRVETAPAVAEGADTRQHDPVGGFHRARIAADDDRIAQSRLSDGALESLGRRAQVAGAIIDDDDVHRTRSAARLGRSSQKRRSAASRLLPVTTATCR